MYACECHVQPPGANASRMRSSARDPSLGAAAPPQLAAGATRRRLGRLRAAVAAGGAAADADAYAQAVDGQARAGGAAQSLVHCQSAPHLI